MTTELERKINTIAETVAFIRGQLSHVPNHEQLTELFNVHIAQFHSKKIEKKPKSETRAVVALVAVITILSEIVNRLITLI